MSPGRFSVISRSQPHSVGGGGVVAEIFRVLRSRSDSVGGGVVAEISRDLHKRNTFAGGPNQSNYLNSARLTISDSKNV